MSAPTASRAASHVHLMGARIAAIDEHEAVRRIVSAAVEGVGHWTITANLDHLRRYSRGPTARRLIDAADLVVADGTPLVWASRLAGTPLPGRVAGSDMVWSISERAAAVGARLLLLGGAPGVAERAGAALTERHPSLCLAGVLSPPLGFHSSEEQLDLLERRLLDARPEIVLVALGFPKQDLLIERLRNVLPKASFVGVGISLSFLAGEVPRAPSWTHALGLEWLHRLAHEPRRLARRYLLQGVPFAVRLMSSAARQRLTGRGLAGAPTVHHYGPDCSTVGGMASVIRVLCHHNVGGERVEAHATWRPDAALASARLAARAGASIAGLASDHVVHVHLSERGSFLREGALLPMARRRGLVSVATIHGASFLPFAHRHPRLVAAVLANADAVTCLDGEVRDLVSRLLPESTRVELVPNPVPIDPTSPGADETGELVLFAGEIGLRKGADVLCEAWPLVARERPGARCLMVGPVTDFEVPPLERLDVRGPVDAAAIRGLLRSARVVALPSRAEGMPMILTEAMGSRRPFVSTPVGGIPELAAAEGGVLVGVEDREALAARLVELLADPSLARGMGERGQRHCLLTRSPQAVGARLAALYARG